MRRVKIHRYISIDKYPHIAHVQTITCKTAPRSLFSIQTVAIYVLLLTQEPNLDFNTRHNLQEPPITTRKGLIVEVKARISELALQCYCILLYKDLETRPTSVRMTFNSSRTTFRDIMSLGVF
jgi:hypothetical protein